MLRKEDHHHRCQAFNGPLQTGKNLVVIVKSSALILCFSQPPIVSAQLRSNTVSAPASSPNIHVNPSPNLTAASGLHRTVSTPNTMHLHATSTPPLPHFHPANPQRTGSVPNVRPATATATAAGLPTPIAAPLTGAAMPIAAPLTGPAIPIVAPLAGTGISMPMAAPLTGVAYPTVPGAGVASIPAPLIGAPAGVPAANPGNANWTMDQMAAWVTSMTTASPMMYTATPVRYSTLPSHYLFLTLTYSREQPVMLSHQSPTGKFCRPLMPKRRSQCNRNSNINRPWFTQHRHPILIIGHRCKGNNSLRPSTSC